MNRKIITVKEIMHEKHIELEGTDTVKEALTAMKENNSDVVIVKKRDQHDSFGIVLLSDVAKNVLAKDKAPERVNIYEIMSKPIIPIDPDMDVRHCARLFDRFGLANAPVIENGTVLGIISYRELVFDGLYELSQ